MNMEHDVTERVGRLRDFWKSAQVEAAIWILIVALAAATLAIAHVPLGRFNLVIALLIAAVQIALVGLFFMNLRDARGLIALTASAAFLFVFVLFALSLNDLFTRP